MRSSDNIRLLVLALALPCSMATGQAAPTASRNAPAGQGEIRGKLVDSASSRALNSGSVSVRRDTTVVAGVQVKDDGTFRVDGLAAGTYNIRIRAIGFAQVVRGGIVVSAEKPVVDL